MSIAMLIVLSPAKTLDFESPVPSVDVSVPDFLDDSAVLIERLRAFSPAELASLMSLSDALAGLNVARNLAWQTPFTPQNARAAVLAFNGDVYEGLAARELSAGQLEFAQRHLRILSGLYGLLRPLDLIQPYRLEMGTRLSNPRGRDLYAFWGESIANALNRDLGEAGSPVVVNLASEEYFRSVRLKALRARVVTPVFEDFKGGRYKVISFFAKRARGLMARYALVNRLEDVEALRGFDVEGYGFDAGASDADVWVFRRRLEAAA